MKEIELSAGTYLFDTLIKCIGFHVTRGIDSKAYRYYYPEYLSRDDDDVPEIGAHLLPDRSVTIDGVEFSRVQYKGEPYWIESTWIIRPE